MGATASSEMEPDGGDMDDAWMDRAWKDGVPFTLLHDDAFVAEKYQELRQNRPETLGASAADDDGDVLEMTGTDELHMDELERMADAARIKLFTVPPVGKAARETGEGGDGERSGSSAQKARRRTAANALTAMEGTALARESRERIASERRRTQQCAIVRDYMAFLARRMEKRAKATQERERQLKMTQEENKDATTELNAVGTTARGAVGRRTVSAPGQSLFQVGSFRMQLEMLRAFRSVSPGLFENSLLVLLETVLEFRPFALHRTQDEKDAAAVNELLIEDVERFSREMLALPELSKGHRALVLVLLLALGVSSGRSGLLVEFVAQVLLPKEVGSTEASGNLLGIRIGNRLFHEWVEELLVQLESYRVNYKLGTLTDECFLKQVNFKMIRDDVSEANEAKKDGMKPSTSVATDGSYVYAWSIADGLSKIGTGQNFTVAGRLYARVESEQFLRVLREPRTFHAGFYGSGRDATALVEAFVEAGSTADTPLRTVREFVGVGDDSKSGRLYVRLIRDGKETGHVFEDSAEFRLPYASEDPAAIGQVQFAFFGSFVVISDEALERLRIASSENDQDTSSGVVLDAALLSELLATSGVTVANMTEESELILLYSAASTSSDLVLEKFAMGETITGYEERGSHVYHSSIVLVDDHILLSLLHQTSTEPTSALDETPRHRPRTLLRISSGDLSLLGEVIVSASDSDLPCGALNILRATRPIFSYVTEGKRLYEIEMSADCFQVRAFSVAKVANIALFLRSFDINIKQIQCATFVSCFLKILKTELRVGDLDFALPSFYTNGSYMCMMLPSIAGVLPAHEMHLAARAKFDCLLVDCENGTILSGDEASEFECPSSNTEGPRETKSFERSLPGDSCCFDATNSSIWVVNASRATMCAYRNPGRPIPDGDDEGELLVKRLRGQAHRGRQPTPELIGLRILTFLAKHADDGLSESSGTTHPQPYGADKSVTSVSNLLDMADAMAQKFIGRLAADSEREALRSCLCLLRSTVREKGDSSFVSSKGPGSMKLLQPRMQALVKKLIHENESIETSSRDLNVRVISAALALSASTTHLTDANVNAQATRVVILVQKWRKGELSQSETAIAISLLRQLRKSLEAASIESGSAEESRDVVEIFKAVWSELVEVEEDRLTKTVDDMAQVSRQGSGEDLWCELVGTVNCFVQVAFSRSVESPNSFRLALQIFNLGCTELERIATLAVSTLKQGQGTKGIHRRVEKKLRHGLIRLVAPAMFASTTMLLRQWEEIAQKFVDEDDDTANPAKPSRLAMRRELVLSLPSQVEAIEALFKTLHDLTAELRTDEKVVSVASVTRSTRTEVMETSHDYDNNLDVTKELRIPGATQITITFDARSRTEFNYDYVTFFKDKSQTAFYGEQYYSGRDSEFNWPGVNGLPPLVIDNDHCFVYFHSDASNTDWGYKFTGVGEIYEKATVMQRHWLSALSEAVLSVLDETGKLLVEGTQLVPISDVEASNDRVLHSDLLRHGVGAENEQNAGVVRLLRDFVVPPEGSDAARVLRAMEDESGHGRLRSKAALFGAETGATSRNPINTAIRAALAAILHHNMWGMDAYALAQSLRGDVSEQLLRGWKNAQKMREWFRLGDAVAEAANNSSDSPDRRSSRPLLLRRQPSAYEGMSDEALQQLSRNVVERATFLLEMTPMSFSYVSGAKRRWNFLARYGSALSVGPSLSRSSSDSTLGKWYNLLDELQEATELRSLLTYRRSSSERRKSRLLKSVTEQVLEFIQSDIDVSELRELIQIRNERARHRARGLELYARTFQASFASARLRFTLIDSCSASLRQLALIAAHNVARVTLPSATTVDALPTPRLHFGTSLSGCDGQLRKEVNGAFGVCLSQLSRDLASLLTGDNATLDTEYAVSVIKAICIDYDIDDMYLLQESNILPLLLRLLASDASRVRRSAQVLLHVFLSRLVEEGGSGDDRGDASMFQKQLFAAVGLQLEGITSRLRDLAAGSSQSGNYGSIWRYREQHLSRPCSSLVVPVSSDSDLKWNHSIMLWLNVSPSVSSYALKVGDEVRRGPTWGDLDETTDTATESGLVTAITSPTTVRIKWAASKEESEHVFEPKAGKLDVVLARDSVGGVVFCKGTQNLANEGAPAAPWSHFGLFLNDRRQLSYKISCGPEKECVYETNYELDANDWAHVAIIQNEDVVKFYVNGLLVTQHLLDPFLILRKSFSASESKITESPHPVTDPTDQYWPVHIPGASKIRVTFDPLSEIDQSSGFVRFYKNARCNEVWGEDKYTGRYHDPERNFPGALSNRHRSRRNLVAAAASQGSLEIPSDRFLIYFNHSGDSKTWGFRLLVTPEFPSSSSSGAALEQPSLNTHPFYIGEPPGRILNTPAAKCWVYQPEMLNVALAEDEIVEAMQSSCPSASPRELPLDRALHVIGLLHTCSETSLSRELLATPENVGDLITIAFEELAPVEVRCASVTVLQQLCSSLSAEFIDEQLCRVKPMEVEPGCGFADFVFSALVRAVNVWVNYADNRIPQANIEESTDTFEDTASMPPCPMEFQISAAESAALATAYVSLVRRLAAKEDFVGPICQLIESSLGQWEELRTDKEWTAVAGHIIAALSLLGGTYRSISLGGRIKCCASIHGKETIETGYLLRYEQTGGQRTARVLFDCDPANPVNVPVNDVAYAKDEDDVEVSDFVQKVATRLTSRSFEELYHPLLTKLMVDIPLEDVSFKPKIARKENVEVLESEHPYVGGEDVVYTLRFRDADEIIIFFDPLSSTGGHNDYVSFVKRKDDNRQMSRPESNNGKACWGEERYYGESFPGVRGAPPLRIPASSVDVHFHTEPTSMGSGLPTSEWGFRLTAHTYEETLTHAPEVPPTFFVNAVNDIRARAIKSLHTCAEALSSGLTSDSDDSLEPLVSLMPHLASIANAPDDGRPTQCSARTQTFESQHPYKNSVKECIAITFSGAARLVITFDPRSQTEQNSDYVCFFKDKSLTDRWGEYQYSGIDENGNWPGFLDRPPLIIPSDSFTLLWTTDASNVEWGWRFTVSAEYPIITPLALRLDQVDKQAHDMWEIFYEGIGPQRTPFPEEYDGFEKISSMEELHELQIRNHAIRSLLFSKWSEAEETLESLVGKKFRVLEEEGVDVLQAPSVSATVLGRLKPGDELRVVEEKKTWLKTRWGDADGAQEDFGWVKRRTDDKIHVASVEASMLNEDVLVLGVDDTRIDQLHSGNTSLFLDENNIEDDALVKFVSQYSYDALKGQSVRYQSLAYDTHRALAIKYARKTLVMILRSTRTSSPVSKSTSTVIPLQVQDFGSANELLLFLSRVFSDREYALEETELDEIVKRLLLASAIRGDISVRDLIDRCVDVLESSGQLLPKGRGALRILESRHPYPDDVDQYWQLAVPGARKIIVYFDSRSKSEAGCDWVCFYKNGSDRGECFGETQYSGRNGAENWPGCGGRPPLVIDADNFEVHFHSDANQNDWGFKLYAVGIFDEDEVDSSPALDENKLSALAQLMRLSHRVLRVAAESCSSLGGVDVSVMRSSVFSVRVVRALVAGLNDHPQQIRPLSLQLLQTLIQDTQFTHSIPSNLVEQLRNLLATKIRAQFVVEERLETKSGYLQTLVECALFVDLAIDSACFTHQYRRAENESAAQLSFTTFNLEASKSERALCEWSTEMEVSEHERRSLHLQFQLKSVSGSLQINLSSKYDGGAQETLLRWSVDGTVMVSPLLGCQGRSGFIAEAPLRSGDAISVHVDLDNGVVVLRKNAYCVYSSSSTEKYSGNLSKISTLAIRVTTTSASDDVFMRYLPYSPLVSLPPVISPNWYTKVCEAMGMLLDFRENRVTSVVECESEHPLSVSKKAIASHEAERVCIDGAVALEIRFDRRTALHTRHRLRFSNSEGKNDFKTELSGITGSQCDEEYPALFLVDPLKRTGILKRGDRVIRSSDWCYADEDGGQGCVGIVEEIVSWNGRNGCGVRVRWGSSTDDEDDDASTGTYRYGYDGCFDVQLVHQPLLWDAPLVIPGNQLEFALDCIEEETSHGKQPLHIGEDNDFLGTLRIDPTSASTVQLDVRKTKLLLGDDCTIECWFCLSAFTTENQVLFEIATLDPSHSLLLCVAPEGRVFVDARNAEDLIAASVTDVTRASSSSNGTVVEHQWFHLGVVFSSSKLHVYVNGERTQFVSVGQKVVHRSLYVDSLILGGRPGVSSVTLTAARAHVCDVQLWDVALHSEQIRSHAHGIDDASPRDAIGWQSPSSSMPQAPRKVSRQSPLSQLLPPPSPPRSPRSPSRGMNVPPDQKKWIMVNRTGRDLATVRANCAINRDCLPSTTSQPLVVYFEAHVLSTGRLSVGWVDVESLPSSREQLLGEFGGSIGFELPRRRALFNGDAMDLESPSSAFEGLRSPRRRSSSGGSASGAGFADVFSREGDVIGCAFVPATNDFSFYLNGDLLLEMRLGGIESVTEEQVSPPAEEGEENFESLVDEMLALGFSREASEDALEASSAGSTPIRTVQRAIDWLIDESTVSQRDSAALSSPRRLSANSPFASPRRRLSSNSIAMTQLRRAITSEDNMRRQACFVPAATLGAQGAQGIAWNLGQRPFKYSPGSQGIVLSAMQAANCVDKDGERIHFEVLDHGERKWECVAYRHRLQDLVPSLLARWKLDEGSGTSVYDSSGRDLVGVIRIPDQTTGSSSNSAPLSPRSRRPVASSSWWDSTCLPPVAVTRGSNSGLFSESAASSVASPVTAAETTVWGYRFYVIPHFSEASIGRRRFQTQAHRFIMDGPAMELRHDQQLTKYVNKVAVTKQLHVSQLLRASWSELAPPEAELVKWPVLVEIATGVQQSTEADDPTAAVTKAIAGSSKPAAMDRLTKRFKLLQELNSAVSRLLPFTAFALTSQDGGASMRLDTLVREQRQRVLHAVKRGIWDEALKRTTEKSPTTELIVNRPRAMRHRVSGNIDEEGRFALFSQAFRQLNSLTGDHFRRSTAVYHVQFLGENAQDAGGPYRETLAQFADELHSSQLPLLIASSNAQHNVGAAREKWVLNPSATGATQLQMLEFLGKLMGSVMRSQEFLSLQIALLIWKKLASESVTVTDDLTLVDSMIVSSMQKIRTIDQFGVSPEMFEDIVMETFTTLSTDNRLVPLKPHGASIPVTFENRIEFADLVEAYRLHEFDTQIAALLRGLGKVVPVRLLSLFTGAELEQMVCGSPEVDVDLLQRCTEYSSCNADDEHIVWFWQVLRDFSHDERSVFLRFVWGRSRLPPNEKEFPQRFKLQSFNKPVRPSSSTADSTTALDGYLPISHTCFFSVELPRYSSQEVLREKLVYAMYNCQEIDGDGDSVAANQLGWEE